VRKTQHKDIINKDSGNSSKPPSSDGFKKIYNSREKQAEQSAGSRAIKEVFRYCLKIRQ
jgi:hypothetical protein